jgi:replicative DNA helicase
MAFMEALERFSGNRVAHRRLRHGPRLDHASERERITMREGAKIADYLAIDDEATPELGDVIARCTELKSQQPRLKIIAVDYIQLIQNRMTGRRGDEEINGATRAFKGLAKRLDVVMIGVAQCNHKDLETRQDKRPQIRDFQGASGMAQDSNFRGLLYNAAQYDANAPPTLEINFSGRRCGKFDVVLDYDPHSLAIYEKKKPQMREIA